MFKPTVNNHSFLWLRKTRAAVGQEVKGEKRHVPPSVESKVLLLTLLFQVHTPIIVKVVSIIRVDRTRHFLLTSRETDEDKMRNGVNEMLSQRMTLSYCESEVVVVWSCLKSVLTETLTKRPALSFSLSLLLSCD